MNYFWKPYRVTYCRVRQARVGDRSFWRESKKLLGLAAFEKGMHRAALSEKTKLKKLWQESLYRSIRSAFHNTSDVYPNP
jgi:hypothetical protein